MDQQVLTDRVERHAPAYAADAENAGDGAAVTMSVLKQCDRWPSFSLAGGACESSQARGRKVLRCNNPLPCIVHNRISGKITELSYLYPTPYLHDLAERLLRRHPADRTRRAFRVIRTCGPGLSAPTPAANRGP